MKFSTENVFTTFFLIFLIHRSHLIIFFFFHFDVEALFVANIANLTFDVIQIRVKLTIQISINFRDDKLIQEFVNDTLLKDFSEQIVVLISYSNIIFFREFVCKTIDFVDHVLYRDFVMFFQTSL